MVNLNQPQNFTTQSKSSLIKMIGHRVWDQYANNANDGLGIIDINSTDLNQWRFLIVNQSLCDMTEYTKEELLGMSPFDLRPVRRRQEDSKLINKILSMDIDKHLFETVYVKKSKQRINVEINAHYIFIENYRFGFGVIRDISERKKFEREIAMHIKMEKALLENERGLRKQLEHQASNMSQFIRSLVHEIKTPLTPIKAAAGELEYQCIDNSQIALIKQINLGCERINKRTSELCDVFRGELGILKLNVCPVCLKELLNEIYSFWNEEARFHKILFTYSCEENSLLIDIDAERIKEVLDNILSNAFKFTPVGGAVSIKISESEKEIVFGISDTGPGIKEDKIAHIFEAYYSDSPRGLGLGLYLSKLIIDLHGGKIWVDKTDSCGTTLKFTLPLVSDFKT